MTAEHEAADRGATLRALERRIRWLACWTIHNANHLRPKEEGGVKVGGHQASCASMTSLMTALYLHALRPEDRVAVKPHASPVFHAIQYLAGQQTREKLEAFRALGGAQSYPSRTKDGDDVDFSTGSVGLGVAITAFASLVQDYVRAKEWSSKARPEGRMIALAGDAELDEGNVYECLQEGWKHGLRNTWWIIDYNRQSLDGVVREGLYERIAGIFAAFGWDVVTLKHGALQRAAFAEPGGERLRAWIDRCPNDVYAALTFSGGAGWRARLMEELGDQGPVSALIERRSDPELAALMENLGGHCLETITGAFDAVDHDRPTVFVAYTVKGWGTPLAGHKDNHAGLMTPAQMAAWRREMGVAEGREWEPFEGLDVPEAEARAFLDAAPFFARGRRRHAAAIVKGSAEHVPPDRVISTQGAFGKLLDAVAKEGGPLAERIVTTSPDVTVSTNLGPWVNRRGLFSREPRADTFRDQAIPSTQRWRFAPDGQHVELGIAEMNLFLTLGAAGLSHSLFGERLLPVGTLYDPFIARGLDALNYACYQDARFLLVATPSGVALAPEGGAHQSIASPLIGLAQDGLASFEPAFADELAIVVDWAFAYMQRDGSGDAERAGPRDDAERAWLRDDPERAWLRDETGGSVYLRLSTRPLEQPAREIDDALRRGVIGGAHWIKPPGPNCDVVIAYQGTVAPEAIEAVGRIGESRRDVGLLAVTSADRLNAGWQAAGRARRRGRPHASSHVERLLRPLPRHCALVTVIDGHPATLGWLGSVMGHRCAALGVEHFGQTGTIGELFAHFGIDADAIVEAVAAISPGRPVRHLRMMGQ